MTKKLSIIFSIIFAQQFLHSQRYTGNYASNYSGVYGIQENPASFINKIPKWDINVIGMSGYLYSDYGYIQDQSVLSLSGIKQTWNGSDSIPSKYNSATDALYIARHLDGNFTGLMTNINVHLPSFCIKSKHASFGLFSNFRVGADAVDLPQFLDYYTIQNLQDFIKYKITPSNVNAMMWSEIGGHFGYQFELQNSNLLSVGINAKYLTGYEAAFIQNKTDYDFYQNRDTFIAPEANLRIGWASGASMTSNSYNFGGLGNGWGFDIGAEYVIPSTEEDETHSPHRMKFGASIRDLGSIKFTQNTEQHSFVSNNLFDISNKLNKNLGKNYDLIKRASYAFYEDSSKSLVARTLTMSLPTNLNIYWDWNVQKDFYINMSISQRINSTNRQLLAPNIYMIGGRYERRWLEAGASLSFFENDMIGLGTYVRLGLLTIGSDHINTYFFSQSKLRGSDFYLSLKIMPFGSGSGESEKENMRIGNGKTRRTKCSTYE